MFFATFLRFQVKRNILEGTELAPTVVTVETTVKPWLQSAIYAKPIRFLRTWTGKVTRLQHGSLWGYVFTVLVFLLLLLLSTLIF